MSIVKIPKTQREIEKALIESHYKKEEDKFKEATKELANLHRIDGEYEFAELLESYMALSSYSRNKPFKSNIKETIQ